MGSPSRACVGGSDRGIGSERVPSPLTHTEYTERGTFLRGEQEILASGVWDGRRPAPGPTERGREVSRFHPLSPYLRALEGVPFWTDTRGFSASCMGLFLSTAAHTPAFPPPNEPENHPSLPRSAESGLADASGERGAGPLDLQHLWNHLHRRGEDDLALVRAGDGRHLVGPWRRVGRDAQLEPARLQAADRPAGR